eukprot:TRINITY_DN34828_c0_g1_i6.p1 TRINITY_DN34828_c0_g1~~TRINITY_DN34828_c0_g1_i6.p1  ORF type:complete len:660 (-),score=67.25 TRINITY_DN34828_c0_g1_i6:818-2797(-)
MIASEASVPLRLASSASHVSDAGITPVRAHPQVIDAQGEKREVWPEHWGITVVQFGQLLAECQKKPNWEDTYTVGDLVQHYVKPKTKGTGLSYALLVNRDSGPLEVSVMISHAWRENAMNFYKTLTRSVTEDEVMFICALSIYQCEDGCGPSIQQQLGTDSAESPFRRVIEFIRAKGTTYGLWWRYHTQLRKLPLVLAFISLTLFLLPTIKQNCVPVHRYCAVGSCAPLSPMLPLWSWRWTYIQLPEWDAKVLLTSHLFALSAVLMAIAHVFFERSQYYYRGRMLATPNHNVEMYTRLWCVYEMFVAQAVRVPVKLACTLASAGPADSRSAACSSPTDEASIRAEIERYGQYERSDPQEGYKMIDEGIERINAKAFREAARHEILWGWPVALTQMSIFRLLKSGLVGFWEEISEEDSTEAGWKKHLEYLAINGRFGWDFICETPFDDSTYELWVWLLVVGVLVGWMIVIHAVVYTVKSVQGKTTYATWLRLALLLFATDILFCATGYALTHLGIGYCSLGFHRLNWFCVGVSSVLFQGALVLLVFLLTNRLCGGFLIRLGKDHTALIGASCVAFLVIMMLATSPLRMDHLYPTFVFNICLVFGGFLGPCAMGLTAALRWGVTLHDDLSRQPDDSKTGQMDSLARAPGQIELAELKASRV